MITDSSNTFSSIPDKDGRERLKLGWSEFRWPLFFCLSMALVGLMFPLGYIFVFLILIYRFRRDRYDFIIMLTLFFGGYGFTAAGSYPIKTGDMALIIAVVLMFLYKKQGIVRKAYLTWLGYVLVILTIAMLSEETLGIQFRIFRSNIAFIYFLVPLVCFGSEDFDIRTFFKHLIPYLIIIAAFYVIDGFILCGFIFMPRTSHLGEYAKSFFYSPIIYGYPYFVRKYPEGLIFLALGIYPIAKYYKLPVWSWLLFIGACVASQTFTVISGFIVGYMVAILKPKTFFKYLLLIPTCFIGLYYLDSVLPERKKDVENESYLRIKSSIDQVSYLMDASDDVDLAKFGSGRFGQALPKFELVKELNREWIGLGYLHPELTTNPKYIVNNEYYLDPDDREEVATKLIESEPLQIYVTSGYLGLIAYFLFYILTYLYVRRYAFGRYYLSVLVMVFWFGLGAYGGLIYFSGLFMVALAFALVVLAQRSTERKLMLDD